MKVISSVQIYPYLRLATETEAPLDFIRVFLFCLSCTSALKLQILPVLVNSVMEGTVRKRGNARNLGILQSDN